MPAVFIESDLFIPEWVKNLASFRRWRESDEFPEEGRIDYLQGEVWVDMSKEQVFSHNQVKHEYNLVLGSLAKREKPGRYFPDGMRWSCVEVDISVLPDAMYVSVESMRNANVKFIEGSRAGFVEMVGVPDMVLEIISDSSVKKDTKRLPILYWEAGVKEYWLVDARRHELKFTIYRHTKRGYVSARKVNGWMKSQVFGKEFRLTRREDEFGQPDFTLEVR